MPIKYTLSKQYLSKDNLNRLTKTTIDNCKEDRQAALDLFNDIKSRFPNAESTFEYSDLVKSATSVLKQIQEANGTIIKVMGLIQDNLKKANVRKSDSPEVDLFEGLSKLTRVDDGKEDEG